MANEYLVFVNKLDELVENKDIELIVAQLAPGNHKYRYQRVKARVENSSSKTFDTDVLWVRYNSGRLHPNPYYIKIIEHLNLINSKF